MTLENIMREYWEEKDLPIWNILSRTGRGLQFWWTFEQVSRKLEFLYKKVRKAIIDEADNAMSEYSITLDNEKVDQAASTRASGLFRLFNTHNTNSGTRGSHQVDNISKYTLNGLRDAFLPEMAEQVKNNKKINKNKKLTKQKRRSKSNKRFTKHLSGNINLLRTSVIEALINHRDLAEGNELRDLHLYIYYNEAVQCFDLESAKEKTVELNKRFKVPLKDSQINAIFRCVDKATNKKTKGNHYILSNQYIIDRLFISEEDQTRYNLFPAGDVKGKNVARDARRKEKKEKRNQIIIENYLEGATYTEMGRLAGCCAKTAKTVVLEYKEKKKIKLVEDGCVNNELNKIKDESEDHVKNVDTEDCFVIPELEVGDDHFVVPEMEVGDDYFVIPILEEKEENYFDISELEIRDDYFMIPEIEENRTKENQYSGRQPKVEKMEGKIYYAGAAMSETNSKPVFRGIRNTSGCNRDLTTVIGSGYGDGDWVSSEGVRGLLEVGIDDNTCAWHRDT